MADLYHYLPVGTGGHYNNYSSSGYFSRNSSSYSALFSSSDPNAKIFWYPHISEAVSIFGIPSDGYSGYYYGRLLWLITTPNQSTILQTHSDGEGDFEPFYSDVITLGNRSYYAHCGYFRYGGTFPSNQEVYTGIYDNLADIGSIYNVVNELYVADYPITYRLTNCTAPSAPQKAAIGSTVNVNFTFPEGYGIVNPSSDVYVTNNGVTVPSQYANGRLTFTMPDPS